MTLFHTDNQINISINMSSTDMQHTKSIYHCIRTFQLIAIIQFKFSPFFITELLCWSYQFVLTYVDAIVMAFFETLALTTLWS